MQSNMKFVYIESYVKLYVEPYIKLYMEPYMESYFGLIITKTRIKFLFLDG